MTVDGEARYDDAVVVGAETDTPTLERFRIGVFHHHMAPVQ